jgi:hypothetical protein
MSDDEAFAGSVGRTDLVLSIGVVPNSAEVGSAGGAEVLKLGSACMTLESAC